MEEKSVAKLGGVCSIIVGILYVLIGVTFLLVPTEQRGGIDDIAQFLQSFHTNPTAMMLSAVLMLHHIGESGKADLLEKAIAGNISEGKYVTYDLKPDRNDPAAVGTSEFADAVVEKIKKLG